MPPHRDWSRRPFSLVSTLLVAMLAALLAAAGLFAPVEDALTSGRAKLLTRQPTGQVAIVEIDAKSLSELRSWPWPRDYHAQAVRTLHQSGASVIAFDVDFSARSPGGDEELAAAIREAGHVILPVFEQRSSGRLGDQRILASRPDSIFSDAWVGGVNIFPDRDGVVREYPAATRIDGNIQPSIVTLLAEKSDAGDRSFQPDWAIEASRIPRFSFVDVMRGRVPPDQIKGKRILIGATAIELGDRYAVPRYGVVPGVMVQALAAESLLQDRPIQRSSSLVTLLGILLISLSLRPRPVDRPLRYLGVFAAVLLTIAAVPIVAQSLWPVSVDSAAWLFTAFTSVTAQAAIEAKRRLRLRAHLDADSGLPNRAVLELALAGDTADETVLVAAGIERFETIRDSIGLAATNEAIRGAAEMIGRTVQGPIYRIAPDVLAWTQPEADGVPAALRQLATIFRTPVQTAAGPVDLSFTAGLDAGHGKAPVLRIERALSAIGTARAADKPHSWYEDSPATPTRQLSMMSDLRQAMEKGRLRLAYQPKMNLTTGEITDAEALIRWYDESGRTISPDEFIPLAEATGVIREVTTFALQTAALELSLWARSGVAVRVAVNVSALDLATPDFLETVDHALAAANVPPFQLTLEVTESALIRSPEKAIATLTALRDRGIRLAVDDYGTGQSTLTYVKRLPIHELKIDKSFVTTLPTSESDQIMVRSTVNLAHDLGLQVVAEGIEDEATLDLLTEMGCDYAQGYFISKPIGPNEFLELVSSPRRIAACR